MSIIDGLNELSRLQGRDPIDPTVIEGGAPPLDGYDDPHEEKPEEPTPLVRLARRVPVMDQPQADPPEASLCLVDHQASYRNQQVELSDSEFAAIASIVLRAVRRRLDSHYKELLAKLPKRVRVSRTAAPEAPAEPVRRKRGRPRKNPVV